MTAQPPRLCRVRACWLSEITGNGNASDGKWYSDVDAVGLSGSGNRQHFRHPAYRYDIRHPPPTSPVISLTGNGTFHDYTLAPLTSATAISPAKALTFAGLTANDKI